MRINDRNSMYWEDSKCRIISFGINPSRGGIPPNERIRKIIQVFNGFGVNILVDCLREYIFRDRNKSMTEVVNRT